jgi:hypothetical protein
MQPQVTVGPQQTQGRKTETAMIRQEGESSPSVVSNGSTLIADPLLVEPRAGTIPSGVFPKCEFPHCTSALRGGRLGF